MLAFNLLGDGLRDALDPKLKRLKPLMPLLEIENLSVEFPPRTASCAPSMASALTLEKGEVLGIVGESGSGKSVGMLALMGLVPYPGRVQADRLLFEGRDLLSLSERERRTLTGKDVAMIFQEPTTIAQSVFHDRLSVGRDVAHP